MERKERNEEKENMKVFVPEDLLKEIEDNIYVKKLKIDRLFMRQHMEEFINYLNHSLTSHPTSKTEFELFKHLTKEINIGTHRLTTFYQIISSLPVLALILFGKSKAFKLSSFVCLTGSYYWFPDLSKMTYYWVKGPEIIGRIMELDSRKSFSPIQTSLFIKFCVLQQIKKRNNPSDRKRVHELFGFKRIVLNGNIALTKIKSYLLEISKKINYKQN